MIRRFCRRATAAALTALLAAGSVGLVASAPSQAAAASAAGASGLVHRTAATARPLTWTACRNGFQCTTAFAPLDYDQPDGVKVGVALIRLPAGNPSRRIGSLLLNPGGPGGSGIDFARAIAQFLPLQLRSRFDIVGFDPRGIMRSSPLRCFDTFEQAINTLPTFAFPVTAREERMQRRFDRTLGRACARHGGPVLAHMSTTDVARDMDFLRESLGDAKLTYLGFSYGSFLGQMYANLFPDRVRALVIDGVLDPIAWTTGRGEEARTTPFSVRLHSDLGASRTLGEFFRLCDAAGADCEFSGNSRHRYARLAARLLKQPLQLDESEGGGTFAYADLVAITLGALYNVSVWPDAAQFFADLERRAEPATLARPRARLRAGLGLTAAGQEPYPNFIEGRIGVICSDSVNPHAFGAWRRAVHTAARQVRYFGRSWGWAGSACAKWPTGVGKGRYLGPWTARTLAPVLVVGNFFDPATRYEGAVTAASLLPNSRLLSYAGWGHTAYFGAGNFCINDLVSRYLVTTATPPPGMVCAPEGSPFGPTEVSARAREAARAAAVLTRFTLPPTVRSALQPAAAR